MIHSKWGLLGLCAVSLGAMALSVGAAQAAFSWLVLNKTQTTATELKALVIGEKGTPILSLLTTLLGFSIEIACAGKFELIGLSLEKEGKLTEGAKAKLTGCYQQGAWGEKVVCEQHSSGQSAATIVTNELKSELVLHTLAGGETEVLVKIEPKAAGGTFTTTFTQEECLAFEGIPVKGTIYLKDGLGQATTHASKHFLEVAPLTTLFVGSKTPANAEGGIWVKLGNPHAELKWSAMDA